MTMAPEDIERFIAMGTNEEELAELLRQQGIAEEEIAGTRGHDVTVNAGNGNIVPNFADPISGIFTRGRAKKQIEKSKGEAANKRFGRDQDIRHWLRGAMDADGLDKPVEQSAIAGNQPMPMPQVAPLGAAPAGGPQGPPAPAMGGPPNAAPAPSPSPVPTPDPAQPPVGGPPVIPDGVAPANVNAPPDQAALLDIILKKLRGRA